ncbi:MAG TPA: hypothetical protein VK862_20550 [Afifellaceae bacterium]|nr:hypothetical protein [Afifellaceae bacterium]
MTDDRTPRTGAAAVPEIDPNAETRLVHYTIVDGKATLSNEQLAKIFLQAKQERLVPLVFYNMDPDMGPEQFINFYAPGGPRLLWLIVHGNRVAGWIWIDDLQNRTGRSHFCFFRWVSAAKLTEQIGRDTFRTIFQVKFKNDAQIQLLRAEMPGFNRPGLWFLEKVGFKAIGEMPGAALRYTSGRFYPMTYLYLTPDAIPD